MPAFNRQLHSSRPTFQRLNDSPFRDWAQRAAASADVLLLGWTAQELTATGLALEAQLQRLAQARLGPLQISAASSTAAAVARLRWQLTDLQLMDAIDLNEPRLVAGGPRFDTGDHPSDPALLVPATRIWHLHGLLARWKLADAEQVLHRTADLSGSEGPTAADLYAAVRMPKHLSRATGLHLASSLVTEAALAAALGYQAIQVTDLEAREAWMTGIAAGHGADRLLQRQAKTKSEESRKGGQATQAPRRRAMALVYAWLEKLPLDTNMNHRAQFARAAVLYLGTFDDPKMKFHVEAVDGWLAQAPPHLIRWVPTPRKRGVSTRLTRVSAPLAP